MIEIKSKRNYYSNTVLILFLFLVFLLIFPIDKPFNLLVFSFSFVFFAVLFLVQRYTVLIKVDTASLIITYYRFLSRRQLILPRKEITFKIVNAMSYHGGKYHKLQVFTKNKLNYTVDSRDGFAREELESIANAAIWS